MSVVTSEDSIRHASGQPCTICGEGIYRFPYMVWDCHKGERIMICSSCAQHIKNGFTADLIHTAAIRDMHDNGTPYQDTLVRVHMIRAISR